MTSRRAQKRNAGQPSARGTKPQPKPPPKPPAREARKMKPRATAVRVAVLEALERSGGNVKDATNGVCPKLARMGGPTLPHASVVHTTLRGLEVEGLVVLDEVPTARGNQNGKTIVEAQLVEIPDNFAAAIKKLRRERGIRWFYEDERRGGDKVTSRAASVPTIAPTEAEQIVSDLLNGVELPAENGTEAEPVIGELLERINELETEVEVLKIEKAALIMWVRQNRTEVNL